jgi:hypothetical protein
MFVEAAAVWPLVALLPARAQQPRIPRIGILLFNSPQTDYIVPLVEGLKALGYVDSQTAVFDTSSSPTAGMWRRPPRRQPIRFRSSLW